MHQLLAKYSQNFLQNTLSRVLNLEVANIQWNFSKQIIAATEQDWDTEYLDAHSFYSYC